MGNTRNYGPVSEINRLKWDDVNFEDRSIILRTRKKKGGNLTPRVIPMTQKLYEILSDKYSQRDKTKPWIFWHRYWSVIEKKFVEAPYKERKSIMRTLCKKAGVPYFKFHALRHSGASLLDNENVPIGTIQRILGHENRNTTEIYLHSVTNSERKAIQILEKARQKSHTDSHTVGRVYN